MGESYLFLRLHGALQVRLDARLEVLDLLALEALQLAAHQAAHVVEQQPRLVNLALCVGDIGAELVEAVLLRATLAQELVLVGLSLLEILLGRVPRRHGLTRVGRRQDPRGVQHGHEALRG